MVTGCTAGLVYMRFALDLRYMLRLLYNSPFALYNIAQMDDWIVLAEHAIKT